MLSKAIPSRNSEETPDNASTPGLSNATELNRSMRSLFSMRSPFLHSTKTVCVYPKRSENGLFLRPQGAYDVANGIKK